MKADDERKLTLDEIYRILDRMLAAPELSGEYKARLKALAKEAAERIVNQMNLDITFDASSERMKKLIDDRAAFVLGEMQKGNYNGLREVLLEGYNRGESVGQIADRIDQYTGDKFNTSPEAIARTEIIGANNMAAVETYRQAGFASKKWITSRDDRVRPAHQVMEGVVVGLDEPFIVGSSLLMFPGDKSPFVEDWIQCRCSVLGIPE